MNAITSFNGQTKIEAKRPLSIEISFGENIYADAIYSIDGDGTPELLNLMAPCGKNRSEIDLIHDLHEESEAKAYSALLDALEMKAREEEIHCKARALGWEL